MRSISYRARAAPRWPSSRICSTCDWRARTSANPPATKKPLTATSTRTPRRKRNSVKRVLRRLEGAARAPAAVYFEAVRRRSSEDAAKVAEGPGALSDLVDALRELEIAPGEAAFGVCRDRHLDLVPGDGQVRVMVHLLRLGRDAVHEVHRALEVAELERLLDRVAGALPAVQLAQFLLYLPVVETCH